MVGCVEWAHLEVGACMVLPTLHQVELNRVDKLKHNVKVKESEGLFSEQKFLDLNAFHSDLV